MIVELIKNVTLLITLCWMHGLISRYLDEQSLRGKLMSGGLFGAAYIIGMTTPFTLVPGLIFDARTVVLSMAAFFGGPLVGLIAAGITALYRLWLGGVGMVPGLFNIVLPMLLGLAYRHFYQRGQVPFNAVALLIFGIVVQAITFSVLFFVVADHIPAAVLKVFLPLVVVLGPATLLLGLLLEDLRQQKLGREALRKSEAQLRAITEAVPDLSMVLDEDGRYLEIKAPDNSLLIAGGEDLLGRRVADVLAASQAELFMQFIARTLASNQPQTLEYELRTPAGWRVFEGRARRLDIQVNGKRALVLMARDITERVALELERRIAAIAFESPQGMLITDAGARILKANRAFSKISGYSLEEVVGQPTRMLGSGRQGAEFYQTMWRSLNETGLWEGGNMEPAQER